MAHQFTIDLKDIHNEKVMTLFIIRPKTPITYETLLFLSDSIRTSLHYVLTHISQEGSSTKDAFCPMVFHHIRQTMDAVAGFFGEDADVLLDANLDYYGDEAMEYLFQRELDLVIGANHLRGDAPNQWKREVCPLHYDQMDRVIELLQQACIMV